MQGLVDFASQIGEVFAVLLPTFAYLTALGCFLFAAWGFWMQGQPHNPFRGRPWIPFVSLILAGAFASFDKILSMALASGGSSSRPRSRRCRAIRRRACQTRRP